jgi:hypothetical protein
MRRRQFLGVLGAAATWPVAARAQQGERMRRIGTLSAFGADDPEWQVRIAAFQHRLRQLGWIKGRNLRMDYRYSGRSRARPWKFFFDLGDPDDDDFERKFKDPNGIIFDVNWKGWTMTSGKIKTKPSETRSAAARAKGTRKAGSRKAGRCKAPAGKAKSK